MKRVCIFLVVVLGIFLNGCTGVKSTAVGLDNESFLSFYSADRSISDIEVNLQQKGTIKAFSAEVNKMTRNSTNFQKIPNGKVYSISTGMHDISVTHNGKIIYSKKIFIGNQETKIIKL